MWVYPTCMQIPTEYCVGAGLPGAGFTGSYVWHNMGAGNWSHGLWNHTSSPNWGATSSAPLFSSYSIASFLEAALAETFWKSLQLKASKSRHARALSHSLTTQMTNHGTVSRTLYAEEGNGSYFQNQIGKPNREKKEVKKKMSSPKGKDRKMHKIERKMHKVDFSILLSLPFPFSL